MAGTREFEFQRLHGMGEQIYETLAELEGERPTRLRRLMAEAETVLGALAAVPGWELVTMRFLSSRVAKDRQVGRIGIVEFRARLLAP